MPIARIRAVTRWACICVALAVATYALLESKPVTLSVWPGYAQMHPATFVFVVIIPRHEDNRQACLAYEGPESRSFCWTMNGANERRSWRIEWAIRAPGEYAVAASLTRIEEGRERRYIEGRTVQVLGGM